MFMVSLLLTHPNEDIAADSLALAHEDVVLAAAFNLGLIIQN